MRTSSLVTEIRFHRAAYGDRDRGLLGWVTLVLLGLRIDGVQIRRTKSGQVAVFWPERVDRCGDKHAVVWPLDDATRAGIERDVIDHLERRGQIT